MCLLYLRRDLSLDQSLAEALGRAADALSSRFVQGVCGYGDLLVYQDRETAFIGQKKTSEAEVEDV